MQVPVKATVMWAFLNKTNDMSGKYQVDLCQLSDKAVESLEGLGIKVLSKEDKGRFVTCKSSHPIKAFSDKGVEMDGDIIGNGSECVAAVGFYEWSFKGKKGVSPSLKKLKMTKVVEYMGSGGGGDDLEVDDDDIL